MHLYGTDVCITTQGRLLYLTKPYFSEQGHIIFIDLFIEVCNPLSCFLKYECNIWLYSTLTE